VLLHSAFSDRRPLASFWRTVVRFDKSKLQFSIAARNALGAAIPLVVGALAGSPQSGLVASIGALNVSFSDRYDPYFQRGRRMLAASLLVAFAVFAGGVSGQHRAFAALLVAPAGFVAGLMVALGQTPSDIAVTSLVTLIVFSAQGLTFYDAAGSALLAFAGGLLETLLALAFWPLQRDQPERHALAGAYRELAAIASGPADASRPPPATNQMTEAHNLLSRLHTRHTIQAERYLSLLNQAERIRLRLLTLARLRERLKRETDGRARIALLDRALDLAASLLRSIGDGVAAEEAPPPTSASLQELHQFAEDLREPVKDSHVAAMRNDARIQLDALLGQLRSVIDLASHVTLSGEAEFVHRQAGRHWTLRLAGVLATLRANMTLRSSSFRHAVRLAACLAAAEILAGSLGWRRSYWLPMTIAIVLKPDFTSTFTRGVLRFGGTFLGLIATTVLFHFLTPGIVLEIALITLSIFLLRYIGAANYGLLTANVSAMVVMLIALTGIAPSQVIGPRAMNTAAGGAIALVAYVLWPTWEREQVAEALADMLDAYRDSLHAVRTAYLHPNHSYAVELDRARQAGRVARTNAEASVDRVLAEPGISPERAQLLAAFLAGSHRLAHAIMSLEAGLTTSDNAPPRAEFRIFTHDAELTMHSLSAALRGSRLAAADLPDLREEHHALLAATGDQNLARYALVNTETDRLTNSLNTLSEQVLKWIGRHGGRSV
jgi:uncharacterized membrane protein YccC